jgi:ubiquinone/menaquinone biosynthesis C-methylase UbiE
MAARRLIDRLRPRAGDPAASAAAAGAVPPAPAPERSPESQWFWDHYELAAGQIAEIFDAEGLSLSGKTVADVGCGDGIMDLGLFDKVRPLKLVGFDLNLTDAEILYGRAQAEGVAASPREGLVFERSATDRLPAEDGAFDYAFSWSAFEHISQPIEVLREIRRVIAPGGAFFLQLWPFYFSAKGSHLWEWFPEDHHHLQRAESEIAEEVLASDLKPRDWTEMMAREFRQLNRITVDELQRSMLAAGFVVRRLELLASPTRLTPELARYSWLDLGVSGIKLIATAG